MKLQLTNQLLFRPDDPFFFARFSAGNLPISRSRGQSCRLSKSKFQKLSVAFSHHSTRQRCEMTVTRAEAERAQRNRTFYAQRVEIRVAVRVL